MVVFNKYRKKLPTQQLRKKKRKKLSEVILMPRQSVQTDYFYDPIFTIAFSICETRRNLPSGNTSDRKESNYRVVLGYPQSPFSCTKAVQ